MSAAIAALIVGTLLAVGALAFVLYPLFFGAPVVQPLRHQTKTAWSEDVAVAALREIEFDRATGKLSDADYAQLREQYTREALATMRRTAPPDGTEGVPADDIEAAIRAYRLGRPTCESCGPRPEEDAVFCSTCGRYLPGNCEQCGRHVEEMGACFCAACGHKLAA